MNPLSAFLPESCIHDDLITRLAYTRDASMYRLIPEAVVRPKDEQEVRSLLEYGAVPAHLLHFVLQAHPYPGNPLPRVLLQKSFMLGRNSRSWKTVMLFGASLESMAP